MRVIKGDTRSLDNGSNSPRFRVLFCGHIWDSEATMTCHVSRSSQNPIAQMVVSPNRGRPQNIVFLFTGTPNLRVHSSSSPKP